MRTARLGTIRAAVVLAALCALFATYSLVRAKLAAERFFPPLESAQLVGLQLSICGSVAQHVTSTGCHALAAMWVLEYRGNFPAPSCGPPPVPGSAKSAAQCPAPNHREWVFVELLSGKVLFASTSPS